jgi:hypothetical protein
VEGGHRPSVGDSADAWSLARSSVPSRDPSAVVLIGASRIIMDIDLASFAEDWGGRKPVQLAVVGSDCRPVLRHLADDTSFCGTIICDVTPNTFFTTPAESNIQVEYIQKYETRRCLALVEQRLRATIQSACAFRLPELSPTVVFGSIVGRNSLPSPRWQTTAPDRSMRADFSKTVDHAGLEAQWVRNRRTAYGVPPEQLQSDLAALEERIERIQRRGGQVVFVQFPTSGRVREIEEQRFARARYWDVLAGHTRGITIHSADYPNLAKLRCPDGSHLDQSDAVRFTREFVPILKARLQKSIRPAPS